MSLEPCDWMEVTLPLVNSQWKENHYAVTFHLTHDYVQYEKEVKEMRLCGFSGIHVSKKNPHFSSFDSVLARTKSWKLERLIKEKCILMSPRPINCISEKDMLVATSNLNPLRHIKSLLWINAASGTQPKRLAVFGYLISGW